MEDFAVREAPQGYLPVVAPAAQDDVPPGYKRTEVGVIPKDWSVTKLDQLAKFRTGPFGTALHKSDYIEGGVPLINPMHITDGQLLPDPKTSISEEAARRLASYRMRPDDIVIGRRGDMGRCAVVHEDQAGWLCGTGSLIIRCSDRANSVFIQRILTTKRVIDAIEDGSVGSTMTNLNQGALSRLQIQLPSLSERHAIATALSDVDALIDSLDLLIAKKRAIKQAAMQQLLTGQARLPGFTGDWESKRLGDHVMFLKTGANSRAELSQGAGVAYLHYGDIHGLSAPGLGTGIADLPRISKNKVSRLDRLQVGDLILVDASEDLDGVGKSVEIRQVPAEGIVAGLHTVAARFNKDVLADGFKGYLQFCPAFSKMLKRLAAGTKVLATNRKHIAEIEISLPPTDEQVAIANALSDMDAEIEALERRRDKARQIKQGMMQQLLTGRVRLVRPEAAL